MRPFACSARTLRASAAAAVTALGLSLGLLAAPSTAHGRSDPSETSASDDAPIYCLDPVHTRVMLGVEHAGFSKALGTISGSTGELRFDADAWPQAEISVVVPVTRLDFGDAKWNKAVLAGNLLDAARYPSATFLSNRVEVTGEDRATVHGTLTLHGIAQPVALDVGLNASKRHPMPPFRRTVGFSARGLLSRKAFGIDAWPNVIGDEVELRIEAEATRGRCDHHDGDAKASTTTESLDPASPSKAPAEASSETSTEPAPEPASPSPETPR
jgi:polyisoprenoid-binding protein YceI